MVFLAKNSMAELYVISSVRRPLGDIFVAEEDLRLALVVLWGAAGSTPVVLCGTIMEDAAAPRCCIDG